MQINLCRNGLLGISYCKFSVVCRASVRRDGMLCFPRQSVDGRSQVRRQKKSMDKDARQPASPLLLQCKPPSALLCLACRHQLTLGVVTCLLPRVCRVPKTFKDARRRVSRSGRYWQKVTIRPQGEPQAGEVVHSLGRWQVFHRLFVALGCMAPSSAICHSIDPCTCASSTHVCSSPKATGSI